jgi:manganese transport protein
MPHAIYLHSAMSQRLAVADRPARRRRLRIQRREVAVAMVAAGTANVLMLVAAATTFHPPAGVTTLAGAHDAFAAVAGDAAALTFAAALLLSGLASSTVGTYAGQTIMRGFTARELPLWSRRVMTLAPGVLLVAAGADPSRALVISQAVLAFGIPFALVPLVRFTASADIMGELANGRLTAGLSWVITGLVIALNAALLAWTFAT